MFRRAYLICGEYIDRNVLNHRHHWNTLVFTKSGRGSDENIALLDRAKGHTCIIISKQRKAEEAFLLNFKEAISAGSQDFKARSNSERSISNAI
jgi:hypothetical protein